MGILVDVMSCRDADKRTAYPRGLVLVAAFGMPVAGPFEPDGENREQPAVMLTRKRYSFGEVIRAELADRFVGECGWIPKRGDGAGPMFNGRFVWTGDSRFGEASGQGVAAQPVKLFDRWESAEQLRSMAG